MDDTKRQALREAIRHRVCAVCLDRGDDGRCALALGRRCALESHIDRVVETVTPFDGRSLYDYQQAIREKVCGQCSLQDEDGRCSLQPRSECALDSHLPLVVEAIREVEAREGVPRPKPARTDI